MANLSFSLQAKLEFLLQMKSGFVLDFSNRSISFFFDKFGIDIEDPKYSMGFYSSSKANRLRGFWKIENNKIVSKVTIALLDYGVEINKIDILSARLYSLELSSLPVESNLDLNQILRSEFEDFLLGKILAKDILLFLEENLPSNALDRLHSLAHDFISNICLNHNISITYRKNSKKSLHFLIKDYLSFIQSDLKFCSSLIPNLLETSFSNFEKFNDIRNNYSLAHPNRNFLSILDIESSFILNQILSSLKFIKDIELYLEQYEDIPF